MFAHAVATTPGRSWGEPASEPTARQVRSGAWFSVGEERWRLRRRVSTASMPWSVSVAPGGRVLFVAHVGVGRRHRDNVWRFDAETLQVTARAAFRGHGVETALLERSAALWVTNSRTHELVELDPATLAVRRSIATPRVPKDFVVTEDEKTAYVASWGAGTVAAIDLVSGRTRSVIRSGRHTRGVALSPGQDQVYAFNFGDGTVTFIDTATSSITKRMKVCRAPRHGRTIAAGDQLLLTCYGSDELVFIDTAAKTVIDRLAVAAGPKTVVVGDGENLALIAAERGNALSVVNLRRRHVVRVPLPARKPCGVALSPDQGRVYVTARGSHQLLELERRPAPRDRGADGR